MAIIGKAESETLNGTNADDQIYALGGNDFLFGLLGNDYLDGGDGDDTIEGGAGGDTSVGGAGKDIFVITRETTAANNGILDFQLGLDRIDFTKLGISSFATLQLLLGEDNLGNAGFGYYTNGAFISTVLNGIVKDDFIPADFIFASSIVNDTLTGGNLADDLFGGFGNDTLSGGAGNDRLFGEQGDDRLYGNNSTTPNGAADGDDRLDGGAGNDQLFGGSGNDNLLGGEGDDQLTGGSGSDVLTGGAGSDRFVLARYGASQNDSIADFVAGTDKLDVSNLGISDFDTIKAISGISTTSDLVIGYKLGTDNTLVFLNGVFPGSLSAGDIIYSTEIASSSILGTAQADDLFGGLGNDVISGLLGNDRLFGEQGDDILYGYDSVTPAGTQDGDDNLYGGAGNDQLFGGSGNDVLVGGSGNDILNGGKGSDKLDGGVGTDTASYSDSDASVTIRLWEGSASGGYAAGDTLLNIENITGSAFKDTLVGDANNNIINGLAGADTMNGQDGNDTYYIDNSGDTISDRSGIDTVNSSITYTLGNTLENLTLLDASPINGTGNDLANTISGNAGNNTLDGLAGTDTVSYANAASAVTVSLANTLVQNTIGAGTDTLKNFENLTGSNYNDTLTGNAASNALSGGNGNDILKGGAGNDSLSGGLGNDTLNGEAGQDTFVFNTATSASNIDTVIGYSVVDDTIKLENAIFTALSTTGTLAASSFKIIGNGGVVDADDHVLYNTVTGNLYYDADGSGATAAAQIAIIGSGLALTNADFVVI